MPTFNVIFVKSFNGSIYDCDKELLPTFMLACLLLLQSSYILVYLEVTSEIQSKNISTYCW